MTNIAKHIIFTGRVQGVGFRFTAQRIALRYELTGFVRNIPGGSVEMLAQGHPDDVRDCLRDIGKSFPGIRDTKIEKIEINPRYRSFQITF